MAELGETHERTPVELLELAEVMAHRDWLDEKRHHDFMSETIPMEPVTPIEIQNHFRIRSNLMMLELIDADSEEPLDLLNTVIEGLDNTVLGKILEARGIDYDQDDIKHLRKEIVTHLEFFYKNVIDDEEQQQLFREKVLSAERVAARHGVTTAQVFEDPDLHSESIREIYTPQKFTDAALVTIRLTNMETVKAQIESEISAQLRSQLLSGKLRLADMRERKQQMLADVLANTEYMEEQRLRVSVNKAALKHALLRHLQYYWGEDVLDYLTPETIDELGVTDIAPALTESLREAQSHADAFNLKCIELELDPNNLTVEQMRKVNSYVDAGY